MGLSRFGRHPWRNLPSSVLHGMTVVTAYDSISINGDKLVAITTCLKVTIFIFALQRSCSSCCGKHGSLAI